jgi:AN1-type zinc finger and ubiquitin domain-containing protein 1
MSEGIPMNQQHLVFNSLELLDDVKIMNYKLKNHDTIQLIPAMRGGPINFRRGELLSGPDPKILQH